MDQIHFLIERMMKDTSFSFSIRSERRGYSLFFKNMILFRSVRSINIHFLVIPIPINYFKTGLYKYFLAIPLK